MLLRKIAVLSSISLALIILLTDNTPAQTSIPQETPALNRSVRALGMGNAFIASKGNEYSPFYNPAGLNDIEEGRFKFFSPTAEFSLGGIRLIKDAKNLNNSLSDAANDADKIRILDEFVQKNIGNFQYVRYEMDLFSYSRKNFAAGIIIDERMTFSFRDQTFTNFDIRNIGDAVFYVAGSYGFWGKLLQVGVTLKPTFRFAINDKITYDTIVGSSTISFGDRFKSVYKDWKFGFGADLGLKTDLLFPALKDNEVFMKFHDRLKPTIALTWQDIGSPFPKTKTTDSGAVIGFVENSQTVNLGFAIHPKISFFDTTFEADFRQINNNVSVFNKIHLGAEFRFPWVFALRMGVHQGRISGGASVDLKYLIIDFATYAEESGIYGHRKGDRRIAATINFGI